MKAKEYLQQTFDYDKSKSDEFYANFEKMLTNTLKSEFSVDFLDELTNILEDNLSFTPSATKNEQLRDISFYSHLKMTSALSMCLYDYLKSKNITDFKQTLVTNEQQFYDEKAFILFCADISGIQNFIYNISSKSALKGLRARSFYLEIAMEWIIDNLLQRLELTRLNLIYAGGGHTYLILPNTDNTKNVISKIESEINQFLMQKFGSKLYIATSFTECSANHLRNKPDGSYKELFISNSRETSAKKAHRYSANQIRQLNSMDSANILRLDLCDTRQYVCK